MDDNGQIQIDIIEYLKALLAQWWIILLAGILGGALCLGYTFFFITPMYKASCTMYAVNSLSVGSAKVSISSSDISTSKSLIATYSVIAKSRLTLEEVIRRANLPYSAGTLSGMISASSVDNTEILRITITNPDPEMACKIANTIAEVLPEKITKIIKASSVEIVDLAVVPKNSSSPDYKRNTMLGVLVGVVLSAAVILLDQFILNDTIESDEWVRNTFKDVAPVVGVLPYSGRGSRGKYGYSSSKYGYGYGYEYSSDESKRAGEEKTGDKK